MASPVLFAMSAVAGWLCDAFSIFYAVLCFPLWFWGFLHDLFLFMNGNPTIRLAVQER